MSGYTGKLEDLTINNSNYRQVLYTSQHMQLVVMSLLPGEEIGSEKHDTVDQFFRVEAGTVKIIMDNVETTLTDGMAAVVPASTEHNVINIGLSPAKIYTIYTPPEHASGTIHKTKEESVADEGH